MFDVDSFRAGFPSLTSGIAHFDGPGGTQTPRAVADAIHATATAPLSNRGSSVVSETNADAAVHAFRSAYADFLGAPVRGIVYGRSATQLTYDFSRHLAKTWTQGDEVVVSRLDHDCNVRPWVQAAESVGAVVRWIDLDPLTADLDLESLDRVLSPRTRLVAVTAASNVLGTKPQVRAIADRAHSVGALVYLDGVHFAAHSTVDITALGADLFVCSPYKFFGPHCGVLAASPDLLETLDPDKLVPSTNAVPERFELGTLPYEIMAGATSAVDFLAATAPGAGTRRERLVAAHALIEAHERDLLVAMEAGIRALGERITVHSTALDRTPTLLMSFDGLDPRAASALLAERNVLAPSSNFYAWEVFQALGIGDRIALRAGIAPYTTAEDVGRLLDGLAAFLS